MERKNYSCTLLVDDDPISIWLQKTVLNEYSDQIGHTHEASNGEEALDFIVEFCTDDGVSRMHVCPELVLLDLNMPVMDGFEFLEAFHKLNLKLRDNIRIVIVTSSNNPSDIERLKAYNVFKYINKPLTPDKIEAILAA